MTRCWAAAQVEDLLAQARTNAATLLSCSDRNIAFGETAGRLWANAFTSAFSEWRRMRPHGRVLVAHDEWPGNIIDLVRTLDDGGFQIEVIDNDAHQRLDLDDLRRRMDEDVIALCVPACGTHSGVLQPLAAIAAMPRPDKCLLFIDAAQAVGQLSCPMGTLGIDVLVAPARKWLRGPRGRAVMGSPVILDRAGTHPTSSSSFKIREDARRFEAFEFSIAARLGFATAIDHHLMIDEETVRRTVLNRLSTLHDGLAGISGIQVHERLQDGPVFATFSTELMATDEIVGCCRATGIAISSVSGRTSVGLGSPLDARCRVSPHVYNTCDDILRLVEVVDDALQGRRRFGVT